MSDWRNFDRRGGFRGARGGRGGFGRGFHNRGGSFQGRPERTGPGNSNTPQRTPEVKKETEPKATVNTSKLDTSATEVKKEPTAPKMHAPVADKAESSVQQLENDKPKATSEQGPDAIGNQSRKRDFKEVMKSSESVQNIAPTEDSEELKKKYANASKCRLFVGNLPNTLNEQDFRSMFSQFGEIIECFHSQSKGFGFIRLDTKYNAERAKDHVDGFVKGGRTLRCRYASQGSAIKLKNLPLHVSNEYLAEKFQQFGQIERTVVICDERGKSVGEGIIEFGRKQNAQAALARINEGVFLIGVNPQPIVAEFLEQKDEDDGLPEKFIVQSKEVTQDREAGARFAILGSFEYEWGMRWKQLEAMEQQQHANLKKQMNEAREKLKFEMEDAYHDYQTNLMRQDLIRRQEELQRLESQRAQDSQRRRQQFEQRFGASGPLPNTHDRRNDMQVGDPSLVMQPMNPPPIPAGAGRQDIPDLGRAGQHQGNMPPSRPSRFDQVPPGFKFQQAGPQQGPRGGQFDSFPDKEQAPRPLMDGSEHDFFEHKRPRMF